MSRRTYTYFLCCVVCITLIKGQSYVLEDSYSGETFFDGFNFTTWNNGCGQAVNKSTAESLGMINYNSTSNQIYIGVEQNHIYPNVSGKCRQTVQLMSLKSYDSGLFVLNGRHMPYGCGVWPAFWTMGPDWPYNGEIDIVENINLATNNQATLHTGNYCDMLDAYNDIKANITGKVDSVNCTFQPGCSEDASNGQQFGHGFDVTGGGAWAMEWNDKFIRMFYWNYKDLPQDLIDKKPDPNTWGKPWSYFPFDALWCNSTNFQKQNIYIDTYLCGWAGQHNINYPYSWDTQCSQYGSSCQQFVMNNPHSFNISYWLINYLQVYKFT